MSKITLTRVVVSIASFTLAIAALVFAASVVVRAGWSQPVSLSGFAWIVPVVAGITVGLLGWLVLSDAHRSEGSATPNASEQGCPVCGRSVLRSWRLCPYCGSFIESEEPPTSAGYASAKR